MPLRRVRQIGQLLPPTLRAIPWSPFLAAGALAVSYVSLQAPGRYIEDRILVLRVGLLLVCLGAAFLLDDRTEETFAHLPTPLVLRRMLRVSVALPVAGALWWLSLQLAGQVPKEAGGPLPSGGLTREAVAMLAIAMAASCWGARCSSDRLGGIVGAAIVLGIVSLLVVVPEGHRLLISSPADPRWNRSHDIWALVFVTAAVAFLYWSRDFGWYRMQARLRIPRRRGPQALRGAPVEDIPRRGRKRSPNH